ncbi:Acp53C14c [Drosophila busckii]|uniref:Acp53C14c n=1 Tax=Drosophila busckii TaxID=30019 RepID=A0A0M4EFJ9_DROBS|nr:uncharacterized protein LOC108595947 [Drosophila busckii]ALC40997.1 Acp53C14c [Drosophila busckii]
MKFVQLSLLLCSLLFLSSFRQAAAIDVDVLGTCSQVIAEGASAFIPQIVPMIKGLAECAQFRPQKTKGITFQMLLMMTFQFLQKAAGNQQCLLKVINRTKELIMPHAAIFMMQGCAPVI